MAILSGNLFINWKKLKVKYNGKEYEFLVKAMISNLTAGGIVYDLKFSDRIFTIAFNGSNWIRVDKKDDFASSVGNIISERVRTLEQEIHLENMIAEKEALRKSRSDGVNWSITNNINPNV